jgi:RHS repeat-associated protein
MKTLGRYDYSGVQTDRIVFTYSGNRVTGLKDIAGDKAGVIDYPGVNNSLPYVYDYNGNVTNEPHKQLGIGYNLLNLPYLINWNGLNRKINYFYTFNGEKLRKTVEDNGTITKVDYCGPFVYETVGATRSLKYIATPFGRAVKNGSTWVYEYNLTDHLGNVRVVIKKGANNLAEIVQQKGYYSFGMEISQFSAGTGTSKNWYNGKEIQDDFGLYWYDYGARFYDPMLGRWHTIDPMGEKYYSISPYTYCANNPIMFIDPNGMEINDPDDIVKNYKNHLNTTKATLNEMMKSGALSAEVGGMLSTFISSSLKEIKGLEKSKQVYTVTADGGKEGGVSYDLATEEVRIGVGGGNVGLVGHELKHASQFEKGEVSLVVDNSDYGVLYDVGDETAAYNQERALGTGIMFFQNPNSIVEGHPLKMCNADVLKFGQSMVPPAYQTLPNGPININSKQGKALRNATIEAGRTGQAVKEVYNRWKKDYAKGTKK